MTVKKATCECLNKKCELTFTSKDEYFISFCPLGLNDELGNDKAHWIVETLPTPLSVPDKIYIMASAHVMESCSFASAYDGDDEVGGAVTDLESILKTECADRSVFAKVCLILDALESIKTKHPNWESEGDCHAFINVIEGECDDIKRVLKSPGSSPEDLAKRMGV